MTFARIIMNFIIITLDRGVLITTTIIHNRNYNQDTNNLEYITSHHILDSNRNLDLNHSNLNQDKRLYADLLQRAMVSFHLISFNQICNISKISFKQLFYVDKVYPG